MWYRQLLFGAAALAAGLVTADAASAGDIFRVRLDQEAPAKTLVYDQANNAENVQVRGWCGWRGCYRPYWGGGWGGGYSSFYAPYCYPRVYSSFYAPVYPRFYSYSYFNPGCFYGPSLYFYYAPMSGAVERSPAPFESADLRAPLSRESRTYSLPRIIPRQRVEQDGTFPYDGGPRNPVPMPGAAPKPQVIPLPEAAPGEGLLVARPATKAKKYVYSAYGERPARTAGNEATILLTQK